MIWVKQRVWRRIYMIGLARRAGELGAGYKLLSLAPILRSV
jgi:hypothetical protein